jgi:hypothetical protein
MLSFYKVAQIKKQREADAKGNSRQYKSDVSLPTAVSHLLKDGKAFD